MMKDIQIKLNPYLAHSKNLINYFGIIGYNEEIIFDYTSNIWDIISDYSSNIFDQKYNNLILSILSEERLGSFSSFTQFDQDNLIKQIFPENPKIILISNSDSYREKQIFILISNSDLVPKASNIMFYSCIDSFNGDKKIINCFFALKFYEKYINIKNKKEYYIPKAFVIVSQFPYFTLYSNICSFFINNIKKDEIPKEIIIHYLINYIPSPINYRLNFENFNSYTIPKITGFPYIDFNMFKVINLISTNDLIKIYILIFLEFELRFFSPDHEKLNIFMMMLYFLNYPLTNSVYFWNIRTFSLKSIDEVGEVFKTFYGVNTKFDHKLDSPDYFIVDLEEKKI